MKFDWIQIKAEISFISPRTIFSPLDMKDFVTSLSSRQSIPASFCLKARVNWLKLNNITSKNYEDWRLHKSVVTFFFLDSIFILARYNQVSWNEILLICFELIESYDGATRLKFYWSFLFIIFIDALDNERRRLDGRVSRWTLCDPCWPHRTDKCEYFDHKRYSW